MVLLIIIPFLNGYFIGNIPNIFRHTHIIPAKSIATASGHRARSSKSTWPCGSAEPWRPAWIARPRCASRGPGWKRRRWIPRMAPLLEKWRENHGKNAGEMAWKQGFTWIYHITYCHRLVEQLIFLKQKPGGSVDVGGRISGGTNLHQQMGSTWGFYRCDSREIS